MLKSELKNLTLFSIGKFISSFGTQIYTFCISLFILKITESGFYFSLNLVISLIPTLIIGPIAGVVVDHVKKKQLVVIMDILSGLLIIVFYTVTINIGVLLSLIYVITFLLSSIAAFFDLAIDASKPNLVTENKLVQINSISHIITALSSVLGPVLGGLFYAFIDLNYFLLFNGLSFLFSAVLEIFINFNLNTEVKTDEEELVSDDDEKIGLFNNIKEGFNILKSKKEIIQLLIFFILINFFTNFSIMVPLPFIVLQILELKSFFYGIIQGTVPVGFIVGALLVGKLYKKIPLNKLFITITSIIAILMTSLSVPLLLPNLAPLLLLFMFSFCALLFGVIIAIIDIAFASFVQENIQDKYRGRVLSLIMMIIKVVSPLALLISGLIITTKTAWILPIIGGVTLLLFSLYKVAKSGKKLIISEFKAPVSE